MATDFLIVERAQEGPRTEWLRLIEGDNTIRVLSPYPFERKVIHWVLRENGRYAQETCQPHFCQKCHHGERPQARWLIWVLHEGVVKRFEMGPQIYRGLVSLHEDENWGDLRGYDVIIRRGARGTQPLYHPIARLPTALSEGDFDIVNAFRNSIPGRSDVVPLYSYWTPFGDDTPGT